MRLKWNISYIQIDSLVIDSEDDKANVNVLLQVEVGGLNRFCSHEGSLTLVESGNHWLKRPSDIIVQF
jgi:hypothetical protein